jgi:predicted protein tyrosine phosphatase
VFEVLKAGASGYDFGQYILFSGAPTSLSRCSLFFLFNHAASLHPISSVTGARSGPEFSVPLIDNMSHHALVGQSLKPGADSYLDVPEVVIEVASRPEAGDVLNSPCCAEITCLLSIGDTHDPLPSGYDNVQNKLRLHFADVVTDKGATEEDVQRIIQLAETLRGSTGKVLIHCEAGVSRSPAAALIMYACWLGPGREREAMARVLAQRPVAIPNRRMVELADRMLGRGGRLLEVVG